MQEWAYKDKSQPTNVETTKQHEGKEEEYKLQRLHSCEWGKKMTDYVL
jgi:hypothetical protein